jgi:hypothetical protein
MRQLKNNIQNKMVLNIFEKDEIINSELYKELVKSLNDATGWDIKPFKLNSDPQNLWPLLDKIGASRDLVKKYELTLRDDPIPKPMQGLAYNNQWTVTNGTLSWYATPFLTSPPELEPEPNPKSGVATLTRATLNNRLWYGGFYTSIPRAGTSTVEGICLHILDKEYTRGYRFIYNLGPEHIPYTVSTQQLEDSQNYPSRLFDTTNIVITQVEIINLPIWYLSYYSGLDIVTNKENRRGICWHIGNYHLTSQFPDFQVSNTNIPIAKITIPLNQFDVSQEGFDVRMYKFHEAYKRGQIPEGAMREVMARWLPQYSTDLKTITPLRDSTIPAGALRDVKELTPLERVRNKRDYCVSSTVGKEYCNTHLDQCQEIVDKLCIEDPLIRMVGSRTLLGPDKGKLIQEANLHPESNTCNWVYTHTPFTTKTKNMQEQIIEPNCQYIFNTYYDNCYDKPSIQQESEDCKYFGSQVLEGGNCSCFQKDNEIQAYTRRVKAKIPSLIAAPSKDCYPSCVRYANNCPKCTSEDKKIISVGKCAQSTCAVEQVSGNLTVTGDLRDLEKITNNTSFMSCFNQSKYKCDPESKICEPDGTGVDMGVCTAQCNPRPGPNIQPTQSSTHHIITYSVLGVMLLLLTGLLVMFFRAGLHKTTSSRK